MDSYYKLRVTGKGFYYFGELFKRLCLEEGLSVDQVEFEKKYPALLLQEIGLGEKESLIPFADAWIRDIIDMNSFEYKRLEQATVKVGFGNYLIFREAMQKLGIWLPERPSVKGLPWEKPRRRTVRIRPKPRLTLCKNPNL